LKICLIEFLGGPHGGMFLPVSEGTETIVIREVYEGPNVRPVYRQTQVVPFPKEDK